MISLSKITRQMWHNHPFSQRIKATKRMGNGFVGCSEEGRALNKIWVGNVRGLHKIGG